MFVFCFVFFKSVYMDKGLALFPDAVPGSEAGLCPSAFICRSV